MSQPFLAQITMFAGLFAPRGWAFCNGQLLAISQNTAVFALVGTTYGGDGRTSYGLPDLRGRFPMHAGQGSPGPGLSSRPLGQRGGVEAVTLNATQMPSHTHTSSQVASTNVGNTKSPAGAIPAISNDGENNYTTDTSSPTSMASNPIGNAGGNLPHENMPPFLAINFIIALQGVFPSRN